jgi:hypothetical protein
MDTDQHESEWQSRRIFYPKHVLSSDHCLVTWNAGTNSIVPSVFIRVHPWLIALLTESLGLQRWVQVFCA